MVLGGGSSERRSVAAGGASLGAVEAAAEGVEPLVRLGASVSSLEVPARSFEAGCDGGSADGAELGKPDAPASVVGTNAAAEGDHT